MEEWVGKGIDRALQALHRRRLKEWHTGAAPFKVREHLARFSTLASVVAEQKVRVVDIKGDVYPRPYRPILHKMVHPSLLPDFGFGWSDGETIYLPISISDMPTDEAQEDLSRLLVFFLAGQIRWGSLTVAVSSHRFLEGDVMLADIYWIVENSRISALLFAEYPGIIGRWRKVVSRLIARRPLERHTNRAEQMVEALLKEALSSTLPGLDRVATPRDAIKVAEEIRLGWAGEGIPLKRYRGMIPFPLWGRFVPGRVKRDIAGTFAEDKKDLERYGDTGTPKRGGDDEVHRYMARRERIDEKKNEQGLALNIYEKIISWVQFVNVQRPFDDDPDEDSFRKADELEELTSVQVSRKTSASFAADLEKEHDADDVSVAEEEAAKYRLYVYPEWDYRRRAYRKGFVKVLETTIVEEGGNFVDEVLAGKRRLIGEIRRRFEALTPAIKVVGQQVEGESIDIDAAVEAMVDLRAGKQPDDRLFTTYKRNERDLSVLFLVDLSMSTDSWVKNQRIIDHEKEALIILCEAIQTLRDRYAIYGFSGKTRKRCRFFRVKDFDEAYNVKIKRRMEAIIPYHYTRMGPAIRHATTLLEKEPSGIRLLFIISDGKPNDVDQYEGKYGVEDTRMAIREADRKGVVPFCLTVDHNAGEYLPHIFGKGNYVVVPGVDQLVRKLPELYAGIIKRL